LGKSSARPLSNLSDTLLFELVGAVARVLDLKSDVAARSPFIIGTKGNPLNETKESAMPLEFVLSTQTF
jgi:hypothetical protein